MAAAADDHLSLQRWFVDESGWTAAVLPSYAGRGIGNVVASIMQAFDEDEQAGAASLLPPVAESLLDPSALADARVIILIVLDGYGSVISQGGAALCAAAPTGLRAHAELTSVFPSTTAAALTSLQTGVAPGSHGIAGYTLYLPAARRVVNMIHLAAVDGSTLPARSADPNTLLPVPTVYDRLAARAVDTVVVSHLDYARSPLTLLHSGDTPYRGHRTVAEFALMLQHEARQPGRRFVFGYWAGIDMLAHTYGPTSAEVVLERRLVEQALVDGLLEPLATAGDDVAVIVTADHGLAVLREDAAETVGSIAKTAGRFRRPPAGERRAVGLFTAGAEQRALVADVIGTRGVVVEAEAAVAAGLYGPSTLHEGLLSRIGDTLVLARGQHSFPFRPLHENATFALGAHGSLTPEEMLVPLLVWRFER